MFLIGCVCQLYNREYMTMRSNQPERNALSIHSTAVSRTFQSTPHNDLRRVPATEARKLTSLSSPRRPASFTQCKVMFRAFDNNWNSYNTAATAAKQLYHYTLLRLSKSTPEQDIVELCTTQVSRSNQTQKQLNTMLIITHKQGLNWEDSARSQLPHLSFQIRHL